VERQRGSLLPRQRREDKTLLLEVAKAAAEIGARDLHYGEHLNGLAVRLEGAAKLDNIVAMRQSLSSSAVELVSCVKKMAEDGKRAVEQLRAQVFSYQERIEEAERQAAVDALIGVASRRIFERQLNLRVAAGSPFWAVYLDLIGFKQINDSLGHAPGDDLLKQFAGELRDGLRATDCVGRVSGDEFVVLIDGSLDTVRERMDVLANDNGSYTPSTEAG
jgi:GGDEF domain-containing protein